MKVFWTPRAAAQLEGIRGYYYENERAADKLIRRIRARVMLLKQFPESGRMVPEYDDPALREVIVGPFRVIHRLTGDRVEVLRVLDGRQMFPTEGVSESLAVYETASLGELGPAASFATIAEAFRRSIVIRKIEEGIADIEAGRFVRDEDLLARLGIAAEEAR